MSDVISIQFGGQTLTCSKKDLKTMREWRRAAEARVTPEWLRTFLRDTRNLKQERPGK